MKWLFTLFISLIAFASHSYSLSDVPEQKIWATIAQQSNIKVETWYSIALAESGITIQGKFVPHVFAIAVGEDNSIGQTSHEGFYPNSKKEAIDLLAQLLAEGHTNIGIGMMQVNIKANPDLVADITTLLDPVTNLKAASKVLKWCSRHKIISAILSCYSRGSATSKKGLEYAQRVLGYQQKYAANVFAKPPIGELTYAQLLVVLNQRTDSRPTRRSAPIQIIN